MSSDQIAAAGAFLSGVGAVLGSWLVLKSSRKRWEKECDEKLRLYKEGIETGDRVSHPDREA